jgi:hypothetical protein
MHHQGEEVRSPGHRLASTAWQKTRSGVALWIWSVREMPSHINSDPVHISTWKATSDGRSKTLRVKIACGFVIADRRHHKPQPRLIGDNPMKPSKQRKRYFVLEIMQLSTNILHRLSINPEKGREQFVARVLEEKLTDDPEELFYLGSLAERYYHGVLANEDDQE